MHSLHPAFPYTPTMTEEYSPRVAIVTGASQGIGRAIALRLARDGIDVAVNDLCEKKTQLDDVVTEIQGLGRKSLAVVADVSVEEQVMKMVSDTVASLGCVDIVSPYSTILRWHLDDACSTDGG